MSEQDTMTTSGYEILYVDDEEMALKYFRRALGPNFTVHTATDAQAGLDILETHGDVIGLLVSDQRMPTESGVELLKKVRRRWPHIVRILTTAYADLEDAIEAVNRGEIFRYITKPWDINTLRTEVRQAMELFRLRQEHAQLMREKMNVWQRLVQLGRLRDLIVMSGSLTHLRHSRNAVAQYLTDHLSPPDGNHLVSPGQLDLWGSTEIEIDQTLTLARNVIDQTINIADDDGQFNTTLDAEGLRHLLVDIFGGVDCPDGASIPTIHVIRPMANVMLRELATATGQPASDPTLQPADDGVTVTIPLAAKPPVHDLTASDAANLLIAYLLAFHHSGRLQLQAADDQYQYSLKLPTDPGTITLPSLRSGWLEPLLVRLEGWD